MRSLRLLLAPVLLAGACSTVSPEDIGPAYVSTARYRALDCAGIEAEQRRVRDEALRLSGAQREKRMREGVGVVAGAVFWPAILLGAGTDHQRQIASLKGQDEALQASARDKGCAFAGAG